MAYAMKRAYFFLLRKTFMASIIDRRVTARIQGDFVVFLIGMRVNKPWKLGKWLPVMRAMPKMLKELEAAPPEVGFLGHTGLGKIIVPVLAQLRSSGALRTGSRRSALAGMGRL